MGKLKLNKSKKSRDHRPHCLDCGSEMEVVPQKPGMDGSHTAIRLELGKENPDMVYLMIQDHKDRTKGRSMGFVAKEFREYVLSVLPEKVGVRNE